MQAQIEVLAALQTIDREIKEHTGRKQNLLSELESKEKEIRAKRGEIEVLGTSYGEKEKLRAEKDRLFQDEGRKAMEKRMRMNRIKNAKELQALQREIDQMRQGNGEIEEELIKIMQEIDGLKAQIQAKETEMAAMQDEWQKKQKELEDQVQSLDAAVAEALTRRQSIASQVNGDLISRYEMIFSRRGGVAVVEVAAGICQGCYMNIPPQLWNEIIRNDKLHLCPSCQRILYVKPAGEAELKSA
ncbi:MAG: zinc ribbon domain-containing protein [Chloroflexota bacterium]